MRYRIEYSVKAYEKIQFIVHHQDIEISWHGFVTMKKNKIVINDIIIYPQQTSSARIETDDTEYARFVGRLKPEEVSSMRYQGHSHVNMGVAPSTTDYDYYRGVIKNTGKGIQVFGIFNKKEDMIHMIIDIDTQEVYVPKVIIPPTQFHDILNDIKDNISSIKYVAPKNTNFFKKD